MKLFVLLLTTFTLTAFAQNQSYDATGAIKTQYKKYLPVVNSASGALTKGMVVCLDLTAADGIAVDYCASEGNKALGVITDVSCAVGARCKLQTKGIFESGNFNHVATNTAAGGPVFAGTDGKLSLPASPTASMSPVGVALEVASSDVTTFALYIDP